VTECSPIVSPNQGVPPAPASDERLVEATLAGDGDAFRQLVERHYQMVMKVAYRALGNLPAAEDCAQDVFIKVHEKLRLYRPDRPFIRWLHRVAANTVTDAIRRRRVDISFDTLLHEAPSELGDPAQAAVVREQQMAVRSAMAGLPRRLRDTIVLQVFHELSYQEIALVLNIPIGTVMSRIHSAKRQLRRRLSAYMSEPRSRIGPNNPDDDASTMMENQC
jgi:RNA polymerase sigma-70 factor (ECF subfamily)